eukprot:Tamp_21233.p2 GENE.Tamp_21233~~Tamp_21233.p2  ORF type:complete len:126 (+),score=17.34 Tamp_21233:758-1135(+)
MYRPAITAGSPAHRENKRSAGVQAADVGLAGVGITFAARCDNEELIVDAVVPNGPAAKSKQVQSGDRLMSVDGVDIRGMTDSVLARYILGSSGSKVEMSLKRGDKVVVAEIVRGFAQEDVFANVD